MLCKGSSRRMRWDECLRWLRSKVARDVLAEVERREGRGAARKVG